MTSADAAREQEVTVAIGKVRAIVSEYSLAPDQVFAPPKVKRGPKPRTKPPKYRDPVSGATWNGMRHEPLWIKGQSREQFLIQV
nr:H-NS histone family protein [Paraburkholderia monticola]